MRLPQRVPWASIGELDQLCTWIFADENNLESRSQAIDRVSITPLLKLSLFLRHLDSCLESDHTPPSCIRINTNTINHHPPRSRAHFLLLFFAEYNIPTTKLLQRPHSLSKWPRRSTAKGGVCEVYSFHRCSAWSSGLVSGTSACCYA